MANTTRPANAQDSSPTSLAGHPFVGTWIVDRIPDDPTDIPTYNVITSDGAVIDPTQGGAGVWEATGPDTASFTLTGTIADLNAYFLVRGSVTVDEGGGHATNIYSSTIVCRRRDGHGGPRRSGGHSQLHSPPDRTGGRNRTTC